MYQFLNRSISQIPDVSSLLRLWSGRPPFHSFFYDAFLANRRTAYAVERTPYLQAMHTGTLDPTAFGCLTVQDAHYCYHAQKTLRGLLGRIDEGESPGLHELVSSMVDAYDDYNRTFIDEWRIRDTESVVATETMAGYVAHERRVASEEEPIYGIVAYIPCYYLWPWFARRLMTSPSYKPGVYRGWFEGIYPGEGEGFGRAWTIGNFIEDWVGEGRAFDAALAHTIYRTSMRFELKLFSEALEPSS